MFDSLSRVSSDTVTGPWTMQGFAQRKAASFCLNSAERGAHYCVLQFLQDSLCQKKLRDLGRMLVVLNAQTGLTVRKMS